MSRSKTKQLTPEQSFQAAQERIRAFVPVLLDRIRQDLERLDLPPKLIESPHAALNAIAKEAQRRKKAQRPRGAK
jgi:hypothetical protein